MDILFRKKPIDEFLPDTKEHQLARVLGPIDLIILGVAKIVGVGIFILIGVGAQMAGPAILFSFMIAGFSALMAAMSYAEMSGRIPVSGGAYAYCYATLGEMWGFCVGWFLVIDYLLGVSAVARGWASYMYQTFVSLGADVPDALYQWQMGSESDDWNVNITAGVVVLLFMLLVSIGVREGATANAVITSCKVGALVLFVCSGAFYVDPDNWSHDFVPFGTRSVVVSAAIMYYAYIGFDGVATMSEETVHPKVDIPIGIIGSVSLATLLYVCAGAVLTLAVPWQAIDVNAPLTVAVQDLALPGLAAAISGLASIGLMAGLILNLVACPRVLMSMARDGLLPAKICEVHQRFRTPHVATGIVGVLAAAIATFVEISAIAQLIAVGTLFAFMCVCVCVLVTRYGAPGSEHTAMGMGTLFLVAAAFFSLPFWYDWPWAISLVFGVVMAVVTVWFFRQPEHNPVDSFMVPGGPLIPLLGVLCNTALVVSLSGTRWMFFGIWMVVGLGIYFGYGVRHSRMNQHIRVKYSAADGAVTASAGERSALLS